MVNHSQTMSSLLPFKSAAVALLFTVLLGPVGLLYATFWGGFFMIFIGLVVLSSKMFFPILLFWVACCVWGVGAAESFNRNLLKVSLKEE